jgi:hypothetical protein
MTLPEAILILLASGLIFLVLQLHQPRLVRNGFLVLCILPALYLAVEGALELLTYDEADMIYKIIDFKRLTARQWYYLTSIAITGNVVNIVRSLASLNDVQAKILAKGIHWFFGLAGMTGIFWTVSRRWIPKRLFADFFLVYFYTALLLPTNILALKVANYDMWAMLLSIWGIICAFVGCERVESRDFALRQEKDSQGKRARAFLPEILWPDGGFTLSGIILTTLAAQEKLIAGPLLSLALMLSVLMRLRRQGRIDWWVLPQIGISLIAVWCVIALTYGAVAIWSPPHLPRFDPAFDFKSLFPHVDIMLRAFGILKSNLLAHSLFVLGTALIIPLLIWPLRFAKSRIANLVRLLFPLAIIGAGILGAVGFYTIRAYLHPVVPIPEGNFVPDAEINGEVVHFLSQTHVAHLIKKTEYAYAVFAIALPSVFLVLAVIVFVSQLWKKQPDIKGAFPGFLALGLLSVGMPLVYVLTKTAVGNRYFDIWLFTVVLLLAISGCRLLTLFATERLRHGIVAIFCLLLFLEIIPFRPVVGAFRPWWASGSRLKMEPGKLSPVWPGWGEEAMIAGRHLQKMARSGKLPSASFRLFTIHPGEWLQPDPAIQTYSVKTAPYLSFTDNDYYVLNRAALMIGGFDFLTGKKPIWTIEHRGVAQAWVYRGSDIRRDE